MALFTEVAKLQLPYLNQSLMDTVITTDHMLALLPIFNVDAIQYTYNKELGNGSTSTSASFIAADGTFTPNSSSYTPVTQDLTFAGASFNMPGVFSQKAFENEMYEKSKQITRLLGNNLINGTTSVTNCNWTGLKASVSGSSTQDFSNSATSASLDLSNLDKAIMAVKKGKANLIVTNGVGIASFKKAIRSTGTVAESLQIPNYGANFLQYDGIPIVQTDWIGSEESGLASFYVLYANEIDGISLWSQYSQLVNVFGPNPVINSAGMFNYSLSVAMGFVVPTPLAIARVFNVCI